MRCESDVTGEEMRLGFPDPRGIREDSKSESNEDDLPVQIVEDVAHGSDASSVQLNVRC